MLLVGPAVRLSPPEADCLGGRILEEIADGGPIEGRVARTPEAEGFWAVEEEVL